MELLTNVFFRLLSMSVAALPVMAVVLLARQLLRRSPRKYSYALWFVVWFRLVCPPGLLTRVRWSLFNLSPLEPVGRLAEDLNRGMPQAFVPDPGPVLGIYPGAESGSAVVVQAGLSPGEAALTAAVAETAMRIAVVVWLAGLAVLLVYGAVAYVRLRRSVAAAVWAGGEVWECDGIPTPFVLGIHRPRIYIPFGLNAHGRTYILAHERFHIRRRDHWAKLLCLLILAVYWWNPAVWLAWTLFCRDMEMRCDEAVLTELGDQAKTGYSESLLAFALDRRVPMALAFGEHDAGRRVKNVLNWKRERPRMAVLALMLVATVATVCCNNGTEQPDSWVRLESRNDQAGETSVEISYRVREPAMAWAIYEDVYQGGVRISSRPVLLDGFTDAGGVSAREGGLSLTVNPAPANGGWAELAFRANLGEGVTATYNLPLPELDFSSERVVSGLKDGERQELTERIDAELLTVLLFTEQAPDTGANTPESAAAAVQYRLVLSNTGEGSFAVMDEAQTLFDLRMDYIGDAPAAGRLLEALDVGSLGAYTMELFTSAAPYTLQVNFRDEPADIDPTSPAIDGPMTWKAEVLLALIGNLEQVNWSYPTREDGQKTLLTMYYPRSQADAHAQALGYDDIKELGQTAAGLRELLAYWNYNGMQVEAVSHTASQMYLLAQERTADTLAEDLLCWDLWGDPALDGNYEFEMETDGTARFSISEGMWNEEDRGWDETTNAVGLDVRNALILMALWPEIDAVQWRGGSWLSEVSEAGADDWLARQRAPMPSIRDYGASAETVQLLLNLLAEADGGAVPATEEYAFQNILGVDGVRWTKTDTNGFSIRTYYALGADGSRTPIAESFGWGGAEDYSVDLDGDGVEELVCNVTYGGDGARRAYVYQRRADGIYLGDLSTGGLPDFLDWGVNASWSEYDPEGRVFRLHYCVDTDGNGEAEEEYALAEYGLAEAAGALAWNRWEP
ncbi:Signal transducer regulating beta-lactamase production, contains metallopeptidase domain [Oscillibacter sp. PC13]|uniref:M56 family metallopeptidase n=1 Tax=Oscillibacter sp. PC13 TaxID=1855299 RepID=UPI0008E64C0E|nr:M56 family metallopeptidase [Oscillibacter sp. PC13]SFO93181.1 Signal transducer regulating beta-lactamase production, contains metallopeptidase domain [Oscillibacter sp. PC13]